MNIQRPQNGWRVVKAGEVLARIEAGISPTGLDRPAGPHEMGVLKVSAVTKGEFKASENKALPQSVDVSGQPTVRAGDILISRANTTELVGAVAVPFQDHPNLMLSDKILRLVPNDAVISSYLARVLRTSSVRAQIEANASGTSGSMQNISQETIRRLVLPLPPVSVQRHLADLLDRADAIRRKRREALKLVDELVRATFLEMFGDPVENPRGWPAVGLDQIAQIRGGLSITPARASLPIEVPYLRVANAHRGRLDLKEIKTIRVNSSELARSVLRSGDILVVEGHGNKEELGRCVMWRAEIPECTHQNHLIRITNLKHGTDPAYLEWYLNSQEGRRQMLAFAKTTSGLNTLNTSNIAKVRVLLPPVALQQRFSGVREQVAATQARAHLASEGAEELFAGLQEQAFGGAN